MEAHLIRINPSNPISIDDLMAQFRALPPQATNCINNNTNTAIDAEEGGECCDGFIADDFVSSLPIPPQPQCDAKEASSCMRSDLSIPIPISDSIPIPMPVAWLPSFFAVPAETPIASLEAYKSGMELVSCLFVFGCFCFNSVLLVNISLFVLLLILNSRPSLLHRR
jgi:hypothetical protein